MTQYNPPYQAYPGSTPPLGQLPQQRRSFPFFMGYLMWFSPALWRDAGRRWGGIGFFYLLILVAGTWAIDMGYWYPRVVAFGRNEVPKFAAKVPTIDIKDGVVTADVEQPYVVKDPDTGKTLFVIDTTGATTEPPEVPSALLTRDALIFRDKNKVQTLPLKDAPPIRIDSAAVQSVYDKEVVRDWWPQTFPILVVISVILRLLQMLVYGLIAMLVGSSVRPPLTFAACMRLSTIAVTPVILIDTLLWLKGYQFSCIWWIVAPVLEITLLVFMVKACDEPEAWQPGGAMPAAAGGGYYTNPGAYPGQGYVQPGYAPPPPYQPPPPPAPPGYLPPR